MIVIQGDHGAAFLGYQATSKFDELRLSNLLNSDPKPILERFSISNALKLPSECLKYLSDDLGPVNTVRLTIACASGILPEYVEEKSFFTTYQSHTDFGKVIDVTSIIRKADGFF